MAEFVKNELKRRETNILVNDQEQNEESYHEFKDKEIGL